MIWVVQSPRAKYFAGPVGQIGGLTPRVSPTEGRIAIVTNAGWDAVDAAASARKLIAGRSSVSDSERADERRQSVRQNRVVLAPVAGAKSAEVFVSLTAS